MMILFLLKLLGNSTAISNKHEPGQKTNPMMTDGKMAKSNKKK